jgi:hypothetical protein
MLTHTRKFDAVDSNKQMIKRPCENDSTTPTWQHHTNTITPLEHHRSTTVTPLLTHMCGHDSTTQTGAT